MVSSDDEDDEEPSQQQGVFGGFLSMFGVGRKRSRGEGGRGRSNEGFDHARTLQAAQKAAVADPTVRMHHHAVFELYSAAHLKAVPLALRHHELFVLLFAALEQAIEASTAGGDDPIVYEQREHEDGSPFYASTWTARPSKRVGVEQPASAEPLSPVPSRRRSDAASPSFALLRAQLNVGKGATGHEVALVQLHTSATTAIAAVLNSYESVGEQIERLVYEISQLQRLHLEEVSELHRQVHPKSVADWRKTAAWALTGCGMPEHRENLRKECMAVAAAVEGMARGLVDWTDADLEMPPASPSELSRSTLGEQAPTVRIFIKNMWLKARASHAASFDLRNRKGRVRRRDKEAEAEAEEAGGEEEEADGDELVVDEEDEDAQDAAAALILQRVGLGVDDGAAAGVAEAQHAAVFAELRERAAAGRVRSAEERDHRYGLSMLTLGNIAMIGSRKNVPELRKLRGLIDHATKTSAARISIGSALGERGSKRATDKTLLVRAGRVSAAANDAEGKGYIMDCIDNASLQVA